jgi:dynamin 1-like protein
VHRTPAQQSREDDYELGRAQRDYDYNSPFVSSSMLGSSSKANFHQGNNSEPALTDREAMETELIRALISSYFNIVRESIADQVPKAVMHLLVNHSKDVVQNRLVSELYKENLFEELLYEDDAVKKEREKCEKLLKTYREAAKIVGEVGI